MMATTNPYVTPPEIIRHLLNTAHLEWAAAPPAGRIWGGKLPPWCHGEAEQPPADFPFGPLHGPQARLASWVYHDAKPDRRRLRLLARCGVIWVRRVHKRLYQVWFRHKEDYARANSRRLAEDLGERRDH
jgi:hypothetical protein